MKKFPLFGIAVAILFILLGFYLIEKKETLPIYIGYANIIFWSFLLLFTFYKLATKNK